MFVALNGVQALIVQLKLTCNELSSLKSGGSLLCIEIYAVWDVCKSTQVIYIITSYICRSTGAIVVSD
ncbi:hypothetical protein MKW98_008295 [Papaver atlanticum]|uniref:Uncharacterized protein n=1 Tax=Papaver atlanticum TaxID=357466 RepID=A0AAD4SAJ3_9MAGN|nr:hypothetical protein MKW98_008295 [Papaver atlanticum]